MFMVHDCRGTVRHLKGQEACRLNLPMSSIVMACLVTLTARFHLAVSYTVVSMLTILIKAVAPSYVLPTVEVSALKLMLVRHVAQLGRQRFEVLSGRGKEHEQPTNILLILIHCLHARAGPFSRLMQCHTSYPQCRNL